MSLIRYQSRDYKNVRDFCREERINFMNERILYDNYDNELTIHLHWDGDDMILDLVTLIGVETTYFHRKIGGKIGSIRVGYEDIKLNIVEELRRKIPKKCV